MLTYDEIRVGAVVRLVCGSPRMVVIRKIPVKGAGGFVEVLWHHDRLGIQREEIEPAFLAWPPSPRAPYRPEEPA